MSRRKLTQKQRRMLDTRHNAGRAGPSSVTPTMPLKTAQVVARYGKTADILPSEPGAQMLNADIRATLQAERIEQEIVVGDHVYFECAKNSDQAVILGRKPPKNQLCRSLRAGQGKAIAANIDQLLIVWSPAPSMSTQGIEHYWIAARMNQIEPILIINKIDLFAGVDLENSREHPYADLLQQKNQFTALYQSLDLTVLEVSAKTGDGITALQQQVSGKTSVLMGLSGTGKSSLVNTLIGSDALTTGALAASIQSGKHTTTTARLMHLANLPEPHGRLIDAPGIREFKLAAATHVDVLAAYPDIQAVAARCKFNDCAHQQEPHCAVRVALEAQQIELWRFQNYCQLRASLCVPMLR